MWSFEERKALIKALETIADNLNNIDEVKEELNGIKICMDNIGKKIKDN